VPNLIGIELPIAKNNLNKIHHHDRTVSIRTGVITYTPSDKVASNIIINQSPKAGGKITPAQKINLLVSSGPADGANTIPQVVGQSIDLCFDLLRAKGLNVIQQINIVSDRNASGVVSAQTPAAGTTITPDMTIRLTVNYFPMTDKSYHAYERINYEIPRRMPVGKYEIVVEDQESTRIVFSGEPNAARRLEAIYHRAGNARITILKDKRAVQRFNVEVNERR
jgi:beta-lactam-binding protein with PASTA domain